MNLLLRDKNSVFQQKKTQFTNILIFFASYRVVIKEKPVPQGNPINLSLSPLKEEGTRVNQIKLCFLNYGNGTDYIEVTSKFQL